MELLSVHYHYLGDEDRYADGIHPVSASRFESQIVHLKKSYQAISEQQLLDAIEEDKPLPEKSFLITFDDSLGSQYAEAVPLLEKHEVPAIFFVPTLPYEKNPQALLVHKIHYLLAVVPPKDLLDRLLAVYEQTLGQAFDMAHIDTIKVRQCYRFDIIESGMCKYLFNYHFAPEITERVVSELFETVSKDEKQFCHDLYITPEQLRQLEAHPLFSIGLHTHTHLNTQTADKKTVEDEMKKNYAMLTELMPGISIRGISYPFGLLTENDYQTKLKDILSELNIAYGFTTHKAMTTNFDQPYLLNRWNTNDLPFGKRPQLTF